MSVAEILERPTAEALPGNARRVAENIRGRRVLVFGFGPVGQALVKQLIAEGAIISAIIRSDGVYDATGKKKVAEREEWERFARVDAAFVALPTEGKGEKALPYVQGVLWRGAPVITAEKASIASNPELMTRHDGLLRYNATVGGETKILKHMSEFGKPIHEIDAVVNGTFNFISSCLEKGMTLKEAIAGARRGKYLETDTEDWATIFADESRDVIRKAVIMANHSGLFAEPIHESDIRFVGSPHDDLKGKRCVVHIGRSGIHVGFIADSSEGWLPDGVDNTIHINKQHIKTGKGAGAKITANTMVEDFRDVLG
jgi:homoserine dehydrogenase